MVAFPAFLDTCVLFPACLCDTMLRLAEASACRPLWSADVFAELRRNLMRSRLKVRLNLFRRPGQGRPTRESRDFTTLRRDMRTEHCANHAEGRVGWRKQAGQSSQVVGSCQGSTIPIPVSLKSLVFRVARVAAWARQMATIWASNPSIGLPRLSRPATTSA
jgi:hypothetical protein